MQAQEDLMFLMKTAITDLVLHMDFRSCIRMSDSEMWHISGGSGYSRFLILLIPVIHKLSVKRLKVQVQNFWLISNLVILHSDSGMRDYFQAMKVVRVNLSFSFHQSDSK